MIFRSQHKYFVLWSIRFVCVFTLLVGNKWNTLLLVIVNKDYVANVPPNDWRKISANRIMMIHKRVAMQPCDLHKQKENLTVHVCPCVLCVCACVCVRTRVGRWGSFIKRDPHLVLSALPHTTQWDHSRFACKTWYKHNYTVMNASTKNSTRCRKKSTRRSRPAWWKYLPWTRTHLKRSAALSNAEATNRKLGFYSCLMHLIQKRLIFCQKLTHFEGFMCHQWYPSQNCIWNR